VSAQLLIGKQPVSQYTLYSLIFNLLHNREQHEKHLYNQFSQYRKYGMLDCQSKCPSSRSKVLIAKNLLASMLRCRSITVCHYALFPRSLWLQCEALVQYRPVKTWHFFIYMQFTASCHAHLMCNERVVLCEHMRFSAVINVLWISNV